jgi:pimeloyl-ACP methyl ester carboxylesterase
VKKQMLALTAVLAVAATVAVSQPGSSRHHAHAADPTPAAARQTDDPLDRQLAWAIAQINGDAATLTEADVTGRITPQFLASYAPEQIIGFLQGFMGGGPYTLQGFTRPPTTTQATALVTGSSGDPFVVEVAVEAQAPHRITGIYGRPAPAPAGAPVRPVSTAGGTSGRFDAQVDIGGRRLYLSCHGTGGPTVLLESERGDGAAPWFGVESAVAGFTRVCTYDRANVIAGASDPAPEPRTAADIVSDLHALLTAADVPGPYVLAGHAHGGLFTRLYASTYPADVAGLVLVDATHEEQDARMQALLPAEVWDQVQEMLAQSVSPEAIDVTTSFAQVRAARAATPLRPMPLVVLADNHPVDPSEYPDGWPVQAMSDAFFAMQNDLATLAPGAEFIVTEQGSYIHQAEPEVVVDAIQRVVEAVRQGETVTRSGG